MGRCTAKSKRSGKLCKNWSIRGKNTCRFHGGLSTGPISRIGKEIIRKSSWRHGCRTLEAIEEKTHFRHQLKICKQYIEKLF